MSGIIKSGKKTKRSRFVVVLLYIFSQVLLLTTFRKQRSGRKAGGVADVLSFLRSPPREGPRGSLSVPSGTNSVDGNGTPQPRQRGAEDAGGGCQAPAVRVTERAVTGPRQRRPSGRPAFRSSRVWQPELCPYPSRAAGRGAAGPGSPGEGQRAATASSGMPAAGPLPRCVPRCGARARALNLVKEFVAPP